MSSSPGLTPSVFKTTTTSNSPPRQSSSYPPLQPHPVSTSPQPSGSDTPSSSSGWTRLKRQQVAAACKACHRRKSKCDGVRPVCTACQQRGIQCHYDVEPEESRMMALKRRNEDLEKELSQLWELYTFLQTRPLSEAHQILDRMRSSADLLAVLQFVKDGDLLIQMASKSQSDPSSPSPPNPSDPPNPPCM